MTVIVKNSAYPTGQVKFTLQHIHHGLSLPLKHTVHVGDGKGKKDFGDAKEKKLLAYFAIT